VVEHPRKELEIDIHPTLESQWAATDVQFETPFLAQFFQAGAPQEVELQLVEGEGAFLLDFPQFLGIAPGKEGFQRHDSKRL